MAFYAKEELCFALGVLFSLTGSLCGIKIHPRMCLKSGNNSDFDSFKIFNKCFRQRNEPLVLIQNWSHPCASNYRARFNAITLLGLNETDDVNSLSAKQKLYKLSAEDPLPYPCRKFVLANLSRTSLILGLYKLKNSIWWNQDGHYIIENSRTDNSCESAYTYLKLVWDLGILSVVFTCRDLRHELRAYTYNPFTDRAPNIWKEVRRYEQENGHPLTLFERPFNLSEDLSWICEIFAFDKTSNLAGYPIKIVGFPIPNVNKFDPDAKGLKIRGMAGEIFDVIYEKLNVTPQLTVRSRNDRGIINEDGIADGIQAEVLHGKYDHQLNSEFRRAIWRNEINSYVLSGICYVTRNRDFLANDYIFSIFSLKMWIALIALFTIITRMFRYMFEESYISASLDVLRAIVGVGMQNEPDSRLQRAIFIAIVFLFMSANFFFQGKLSSMLTSPEYYTEIFSPEDLIKHKYVIYSESQYYQHFYESILADHIRIKENVAECIDLVKVQTKIACVIDCWSGRFRVPHNKRIQILEDPLRKKYFVSVVRDDFSLRDKMAKIVGRMFSSGITDYICERVKQTMFLGQKYNLVDLSERRFYVTMNQISFAFTLLQNGLTLSCVVFCLEFTFACMNKIVRFLIVYEFLNLN